MTKDIPTIPFEEFAANLSTVFDRVIGRREPVVVESANGAQAILRPVAAKRPSRRQRTEDDYAAFRSAAGAWKDVDTDRFLADIYAAREAGDRPPVDL